MDDITIVFPKVKVNIDHVGDYGFHPHIGFPFGSNVFVVPRHKYFEMFRYATTAKFIPPNGSLMLIYLYYFVGIVLNWLS